MDGYYNRYLFMLSKYRFLAGVLVASAMVPSFAAAATSEEVQLQIADLMARIAALNSSLGQTTGGTGTTNTTNTGGAHANILDGSSTITLTRDIQTGSKGDDVSRLQEHLALDPNIYPEGLVTGVYKGLTTVAIQRFQVACGIVSAGGEQSTGYGRVGPLTRRALSLGCQNANIPAQVGAFLRITPNSGNAPLTVTAETTINTPRSCEAATYALNFGDGTPTALLAVPKGRCDQVVQSIQHTYQNGGTYNAILSIGTHKTTVAVTVAGSGVVDPLPPTNPTNPNPVVPVTSNAAIQVRLVNAPVAPATVGRGSNIIVSWDGVNPPQGSVVRVELRKSDNTPLGTVAANLASSGQYAWQVPGISSGNVSCDATTNQICPSSVQDGTYRFRVYVYAPANSCWGYCPSGSQTPTVYAVANSDTFTIGSAAITADNFAATTTTGVAPFTVAFNTAVNGSGSCNGGVYSIDFGDGSAKTDLPYPSGACRGVGYVVSHIYNAGGTFTAKLYNIGSSLVTSATAAVKSILITVSQVSQGPFTVTLGVNGVANNVSAVFQLQNYVCSSYSVNWGDGSAVTTRDAGTVACTNSASTITLSHGYANAGTYTIDMMRGPGPLSGLATHETATVTIVQSVNSCGSVGCGSTTATNDFGGNGGN